MIASVTGPSPCLAPELPADKDAAQLLNPPGSPAVSARRETSYSIFATARAPSTFLGRPRILGTRLGRSALFLKWGLVVNGGTRGKGILVLAGVKVVVVVGGVGASIKVDVSGGVRVVATAGILGVVVLADIGVHGTFGAVGVVSVLGATAVRGVVVGIILVTESAGGGRVREIAGSSGASARGIILLSIRLRLGQMMAKGQYIPS